MYGIGFRLTLNERKPPFGADIVLDIILVQNSNNLAVVIMDSTRGNLEFPVAAVREIASGKSNGHLLGRD